MMNKTYKVAEHCFRVSGERICQAVSQMDGFLPFECKDGEALFEFAEGIDAPKTMEIIE